RPGALPELDDISAGPLLALQAHPGLSKMLSSLSDQVEAKDDVLAREAREHKMDFTDGVAANTEHLLKLHVLNESTAHLKALIQCPVLHPYDVFVCLARLLGHLSIFCDEMVPGPLPTYDHDHPGETLETLRRAIELRLEAIRTHRYKEVPFIRKKDEANHDGFQVELERSWIDDNL